MIAEQLREAVLEAAITGQLVEQCSSEGTTQDLLDHIASQRMNTAANPKGVKRSSDIIASIDESFPEIPGSWEWVRLGDLCSYIQRGKGPKYAENAEFFAISQKCVQWSGFNIEASRGYSRDKFLELPKVRLLQPGDLLWNSTGTGTVGRCVVLPERSKLPYGKMAADSHVTVIRCSEYLLPTYLAAFISSPHIQHNMETLTSGTTKQKELNLGTILNLPLALPPRKEQHRIIEVLNNLIGLVNELAILEREREDLDREFTTQIEAAILQAATRGQLTEQKPEDGTGAELLQTIDSLQRKVVKGRETKKVCLPPVESKDEPYTLPDSWAWTKVGNLLTYAGSGSTPKGGKAVYTNSGVMLLRSQNIHNDGLHLRNVAYISNQTAFQMGKNWVQPGDILLNITGASIGRVARVPEGFTLAKTNQHVLTMRLVDPSVGSYLHWYLRSPFVFEQIMDRQKGATKEGLNSANALNIFVALPGREEQVRISSFLDRISQPIQKLREATQLL